MFWGHQEAAAGMLSAAMVWLVGMAVLVAFQSEYLTGSIEEVGGLLAGRFVAIGEAGAREEGASAPCCCRCMAGRRCLSCASGRGP